MKLKNIIIISLLLLLPVLAFAANEYITTQVYFNVASVVSFTLTLPGETAVTSTPAGAPTTAIEFNSTTGTDANVNARVVGGSSQTINPGVPIFVYDNTGTVNLNISVYLNSTLPACITLKGGNTNSTITTPISTTNVSVATNFGPNDPTVDWYMQADFTACTASDTTVKTLTSLGVQV